MNYLAALNLLLRKIGTRQVASVDIQHPDVVDAKVVLDTQLADLLNRGWWFNQRAQVTHTPDAQKKINVGANVLRIEPSEQTKIAYSHLTLHGNKLYNSLDNTYDFGQSVVVDEYIALPWEDVPHTAQMYLAYKAASEFVEEKLEDVGKAAKLERAAREHYIDLTGDELRMEKPNMLDSPNARRMRSGVRPYHMRDF